MKKTSRHPRCRGHHPCHQRHSLQTHSTTPYGNSSNSPQLFNSQGEFRGNLNANPYDANSVSNPYGRYGSQYSPDSINNPYGAGSRYNKDSPKNFFGSGLTIIGR
jgi:hypothetical protein